MGEAMYANLRYQSHSLQAVLFVCMANSCRSQIAEGFARYYGAGAVRPLSAGIRPHRLDHMAVLVMKERGIDISHQYSKGLEAIRFDDVRLLVTLCRHAAAKLPCLPSHVHRLDWNIADPNAVPGGAPVSTYRQLREDLEGKIKVLLPLVERLPPLSPPATPAVDVRRSPIPPSRSCAAQPRRTP